MVFNQDWSSPCLPGIKLQKYVSSKNFGEILPFSKYGKIMSKMAKLFQNWQNYFKNGKIMSKIAKLCQNKKYIKRRI